MKERHSYSNIKKNNAQNKHPQKNDANIYVQMLLDEILYKAKLEKLILQIDDTLDQRDQATFRRLSKEYKQLLKNSSS